MKSLEVALGERSYPVHIGSGALRRGDLLEPHLRGAQALVVTNATVGPLYLEQLRPSLGNRQVKELVLPDGEAHKTLAVLEQVFDALLEARFSRDCAVVALGGGVVGDMAGFAAACYQRGVDFIQAPTTLLAQVDSSVGGKTAVNHPSGKNMIGAFHQPVCVLADTDTLSTLPERELRAGLAEVIKYGLVCDEAFFDWLDDALPALLAREPEALAIAIERSCANKSRVVADDEREQGGRALLNLGHTFGHAIEAGLGFGNWLHGEAVAAGMCLAADMSARAGLLDAATVERVVRVIERAGLPARYPAALDVERMLELMAFDKKAKSGRVHLVLMRALGDGFVTGEFDRSMLCETLAAGRAPECG